MDSPILQRLLRSDWIGSQKALIIHFDAFCSGESGPLRLKTLCKDDNVMSLKNFSDLTEREVLAIAIASEEEDSRIYIGFAEELAERYPATTRVFQEMAAEEDGHRRQLLELYQQRFGQNLPAIRREDVKGFLSRRPTWLMQNLPLEAI